MKPKSIAVNALVALLAAAAFVSPLLGASQLAVFTYESETFRVQAYSGSGGADFYVWRDENHADSVVTMRYRTVGLSAFPGKNFTPVSGTITFGSGEWSKMVHVAENAPTQDAYKFQIGPTRSYGFELTDENGFSIQDAYTIREMTTGTNVPDNVYEYYEFPLFTRYKWWIITDDGFDQRHWNYDSDLGYELPHFTADQLSAMPREYLESVGAQLRARIRFDAAEAEDGYQHVQIIMNKENGSFFDDGAKDADPGKPKHSSYLACFSHNAEIIHAYNSVRWDEFTFPVTTVGDGQGSSDPWNSIYDSELMIQRFNTSCRAPDGRLVMPFDFTNLWVRFDASGYEEDTWVVSNLYLMVQAAEETPPSMLRLGGVFVSPGPHTKGSTAWISLPFSEIVQTWDSPPVLSTTWGDFRYAGGSGSNVITFRGTINAETGTVLQVTGLTGTIKDWAHNDFSGSVNTTVNTATVEPYPEYEITYDLDGGVLSPGSPTSYAYDRGVDLVPPTRKGYVFDGWTGSYLHNKSMQVNIPVGEHGARSFTAHWISCYDAWANANGVSGAWNEKGTDGIYNVFRYSFNRPTGAFVDPPLLGISFDEQGRAVIKTPRLLNEEGFDLSILATDALDGNALSTSYDVDPSGKTTIPTTDKPARFFRLRATKTE